MAVMRKVAGKAMKKKAQVAARKGVAMATAMAKNVSDRVSGRAAKRRKRIKVVAATGVALAGVATGIAMMASRSRKNGRKRR